MNSFRLESINPLELLIETSRILNPQKRRSQIRKVLVMNVQIVSVGTG
jgi:hypothetical protein